VVNLLAVRSREMVEGFDLGVGIRMISEDCKFGGGIVKL
jgi:hypothetical protein